MALYYLVSRTGSSERGRKMAVEPWHHDTQQLAQVVVQTAAIDQLECTHIKQLEVFFVDWL